MPTATLLPLELLESGEWAEVIEVCGEPGWVHRLAELGVRCGCRLRVVQPGSPCLLQMGGLRLSLRSDQATHILVRSLGLCEPAV
jgi:ferrous iron transport protein A